VAFRRQPRIPSEESIFVPRVPTPPRGLGNPIRQMIRPDKEEQKNGNHRFPALSNLASRTQVQPDLQQMEIEKEDEEACKLSSGSDEPKEEADVEMVEEAEESDPLENTIESPPIIVQTEKRKNGILKPLSREQKNFNAQLEDELAFIKEVMKKQVDEVSVNFLDVIDKDLIQTKWRSIKLNRKPNGLPHD